MTEPVFACALPVRFLSAGQFLASDEGFIHQRRELNNNVLMLPLRGTLFLQENECRYTIGRGDALLLRAGHPHVGWARSEGERPVFFWAHFECDPPSGGDERPALRLPQFISGGNFERKIVLFHQLIDASQSILSQRLMCDYFLSLLLITLKEDAHSDEAGGDILISMAMEYLRIHSDRTVTVRELAQQFSYSCDYMSRYFKRHTGLSVKQYQHKIRLSRAKEKLLTTPLTVKEIANQVGYVNEKLFSRVFSQNEGISPSQYRNAFDRVHQNKH
ncbi:MAG: AraC family transcriptional regulator [Rhodopirellula sp.]|nr:AraC family transcriptional regulator [Rhodopirellula sp.]